MNPGDSRDRDPSHSRHQCHCRGVDPTHRGAFAGILLAVGKLIELCLTGGIYAEYDEVLRRAKFGFDDQTIAAALDALRRNAFRVRSLEPVRACPDTKDDMFLECAAAAQADYPVTGNLRHFPESWGKTRVVSPRTALDLLTNALR